MKKGSILRSSPPRDAGISVTVISSWSLNDLKTLVYFTHVVVTSRPFIPAGPIRRCYSTIKTYITSVGMVSQVCKILLVWLQSGSYAGNNLACSPLGICVATWMLSHRPFAASSFNFGNLSSEHPLWILSWSFESYR